MNSTYSVIVVQRCRLPGMGPRRRGQTANNITMFHMMVKIIVATPLAVENRDAATRASTLTDFSPTATLKGVLGLSICLIRKGGLHADRGPAIKAHRGGRPL